MKNKEYKKIARQLRKLERKQEKKQVVCAKEVYELAMLDLDQLFERILQEHKNEETQVNEVAG